ncbi:MAG TPA: hypothetical protein VFV80_11100 [Geminicoccaceae bacterium]|nr:hypothetical protein [Geminicoccaceae bacterium]
MSARSRPARRRAGGLAGGFAVAALLLQGWVPVLLQTHLASREAVGHARHGAAGAMPTSAPSRTLPECPLFHGPVCLCALFVSFVPAPAIPLPQAGAPVQLARSRFAAARPRRQRRAARFDRRAPPLSG